jgi:hypothetical protein
LKGFTAISITLPPVIAGPMLLNESPVNEIFLRESGSELFCAGVIKERRSTKTEQIEVVNFFILFTRNYFIEKLNG